MTDLADAGSLVASLPAGNLAGPPAAGDNGSAPPAGKSWFDGLSEGNRKLAETKGWTKPESRFSHPMPSWNGSRAKACAFPQRTQLWKTGTGSMPGCLRRCAR